ncbi:Glycosyl transferase family 8 [Modestobacter italicus]|uniref:Glycosyl transferase family 8 n=1 Tax=Modestobacter italicus (strain DSM 44449 / CECT 9708 / BC 501) TaxID=2732864 RepID=I4ERC7_MODI5|nr:glycosyltransferase [Modestobacter marinus]CCH85940.1 Glycosyl transferase family 8 [Modestobacter marinus]
MARRHAVCYTATTGYLFHTVVSALQARANTSPDTEIYVLCFGSGSSLEESAFQRVCAGSGITLLSVPRDRLNGLHPTYSRLFLDEFLPAHVDEVLYLDGDTQVVANIDPLVEAPIPTGGALGVRDPMVFIRESSNTLKKRIDGWWDSSGIPPGIRARYINAGVLRISRADLGGLRSDVLREYGDKLGLLHFLDQDAINLVLGKRLQPISMSWNFPGFLLGTQMVEIARPRIIHFMSDPRPWNAALPPWGVHYHQPYAQFVKDHPQTAEYWQRLSGRAKTKYALQQRYKHVTERRAHQSSAAARALRELERDTRDLG